MKSINLLSLTWSQLGAKPKPPMDSYDDDGFPLSVIKSLPTTEIGRRVLRQELPGVTLTLAVNTIPSKKQKDPTVSRIPTQTLKSRKTESRRNKIAVHITTIWLGTISKWSF